MQNTDTPLLRAAEPGALPNLGQDEIHVWIIAVTARRVGDVEGIETLTPAERARASRFRSELNRTSFMQRRAALRMILAGYLEVAPRDIAFTLNEFGKPSVDAPQGSAAFSFNTSHSGTVAMIALTRSGHIGIDVERLRPLVEAENIAAHFFTPNEAATLAALDPRDRVEGFFNAWTRKEAVVKALGGGLSIPLNSFEVSLRPREPPEILRWDIPSLAPQQWRIHHLDPVLGYVGALAVDCEASIYRCWKWPR